jgi:hypothetical protein
LQPADQPYLPSTEATYIVLEGLFPSPWPQHNGQERILYMQLSSVPQRDIWPSASYRCPRCTRLDTIPMPADNVLDKLIGCIRYAPFKCRACRTKFYRRPQPAPDSPPVVESVESAPVRNVAVCQRDPANTLRRLDKIIRIAEGRRLRRG